MPCLRPLASTLILLTGGVGAGLCRVEAQPPPVSVVRPDPRQVEAARRLAATASLAAVEYRLGVRDGKVVAQPEVEETRLFLTEARRYAERLPGQAGDRAVSRIDRLLSLVAQVGSPDSVESDVAELLQRLGRDLGGTLDEVPG